MPIYEYQCREGHVTEKFYTTFSEAEKDGDKPKTCKVCRRSAKRIVSAPLPGMFFGNPEGYGKPSTLKRHNTKVVSAKEGNSSAVG